MDFKKISIVLNVILTAAVVLLHVDRFANNKGTKDKKIHNTETNSSNSTDIVYINIDTLFDNYDLYNSLKLDFMQKQKDFENQLNSKLLSYQQRATSLQQKYEKHLITSATYQKKGEALMMEQQQIAQWKDQISYELMEDEQNITQRVYDSVLIVVNEYNRKLNHKLIINNSFGGALLYGEKTLNITDTIAMILNEKVSLFENNEAE